MQEGKTKSTGPDVLSLGAGCLWGCFDPVLGQSGRASVGSISTRFPVWGWRRRRLLGAFCASRRAQGMAWRRGGAVRLRRRLGFAAWESPADSRAGAGRNKVGGGADGGASARLVPLPAAWRRAQGRGASDLGGARLGALKDAPKACAGLFCLGFCVFCPSLGAAGQIDRRGRVAYIGRCGPPGRSKRGGSVKNGGRGPRRRRRICAPGLDPGAMEKNGKRQECRSCPKSR